MIYLTLFTKKSIPKRNNKTANLVKLFDKKSVDK